MGQLGVTPLIKGILTPPPWKAPVPVVPSQVGPPAAPASTPSRSPYLCGLSRAVLVSPCSQILSPALPAGLWPPDPHCSKGPGRALGSWAARCSLTSGLLDSYVAGSWLPGSPPPQGSCLGTQTAQECHSASRSSSAWCDGWAAGPGLSGVQVSAGFTGLTGGPPPGPPGRTAHGIAPIGGR